MNQYRPIAVLAAIVILSTSGTAGAQVLFRDWHLTMTDIQVRSRASVMRGERRHDAQGSVHVQGILAARQGSESHPEQAFFDADLTTTLLRNTEYDPDLVRSSISAGYRRLRRNYGIDIYGEHLRRMNTDTAGRRSSYFFGISISDPEFQLRRFGARSRFHGKIGAGSLVNEGGFQGDARFLAAVRYDFHEFSGQAERGRIPKGQIFLEGEVDAIDGPGGLMADLEIGFRFLFFPDADNSLSLAAKFYDSKNPLGHSDDGIRIDLDLEGSHAGTLFRSFLGNTSGELGMGIRGDDVSTELEADFDLIRKTVRGRDYLLILDTLQRAAWGKLNKIEYNIEAGIESVVDERSPKAIRNFRGLTAGFYVDHRSTHGLDRNLREKSYNLLRFGVKSQGWDSGREDETIRRMAYQISAGSYVDNTYKKSRDLDARAGIRLDGPARPWRSWTMIPYLRGTIRSATNQGSTAENAVEVGIRFNGHALFARWIQDAFFEEGGLGGLALRF